MEYEHIRKAAQLLQTILSEVPTAKRINEIAFHFLDSHNLAKFEKRIEQELKIRRDHIENSVWWLLALLEDEWAYKFENEDSSWHLAENEEIMLAQKELLDLYSALKELNSGIIKKEEE
jgi:hypothetical protein